MANTNLQSKLGKKENINHQFLLNEKELRLFDDGYCPNCGSESYSEKTFFNELTDSLVLRYECISCDQEWYETYKREKVEWNH